MLKNKKRILIGGLLPGLMLLAFTSCKTPKDVSYFQDTNNNGLVIDVAQANAIKIEPGDRIHIIVKAKDPAVSALFNNLVYSDRLDDTNGSNGSVMSDHSVPSSTLGLVPYTVSPQGDIEYPYLGKLHVAGMTRQELQGYVKGELNGRDLVKDPIVTVEFVNVGVNVMGEVKNPGRIEINQDQFTILDALARSGDILSSGKRTNVRVLRQENGKTHAYTVDLTNASATMGSPVYYMKQGDVVYVEPTDVAKRQTTAFGTQVYNMSFWISVASMLTSVATTVGVLMQVK